MVVIFGRKMDRPYNAKNINYKTYVVRSTIRGAGNHGNFVIWALIAQLGERQTEDLKVPCSIHGQSMIFTDHTRRGAPDQALIFKAKTLFSRLHFCKLLTINSPVPSGVSPHILPCHYTYHPMLHKFDSDQVRFAQIKDISKLKTMG